MTYKELLKALANYDGNWDDEVVFAAYNDKYSIDNVFSGARIYKITSIGAGIDNKCRLNNYYDI